MNENVEKIEMEIEPEEETVVCQTCGRVISREDAVEIDDEIYCEDCVYTCDECGATCPIEYSQGAVRCDEPVVVCETCADRYYEVCSACGDWVHRDDVEESRGCRVICSNCADRYHFCAECGTMLDTYHDYFHVDRDGDYFCEDCFDEDADNGSINDYSFDPEWEYLGGDGYIYDGNIRYGVELEVDGKDNDAVMPNACAEKILDNVSNVYCKHDGSLARGFEIISHPATIDYHLNDLDWGGICDIAREFNFFSHDVGTCGLHVHVGREALCEDADAKIVALVDHIWDKMERFARRRANGYAQRLNAEINPDDLPEVMIKKAKDCCRYDRYKAINISSKADTIEFRIYKGTLKESTILATLIFTDCIVRYCNNHTIKQCSAAKFEDVVAMSDSEILHGYLRERKLED